MGMRSFNVTLSGSVQRLSDGSQRARNYALSVRQNSGNAQVVTTYTEYCAYTGAVLQSVSFGIGGRGGLPTPVQLKPVVGRELHDMYQSILPKMAEFMQAMGSELLQERLKR